MQEGAVGRRRVDAWPRRRGLARLAASVCTALQKAHSARPTASRGSSSAGARIVKLVKASLRAPSRLGAQSSVSAQKSASAAAFGQSGRRPAAPRPASSAASP